MTNINQADHDRFYMLEKGVFQTRKPSVSAMELFGGASANECVPYPQNRNDKFLNNSPLSWAKAENAFAVQSA